MCLHPGTLDINSVLRSFAAVSAANGNCMTPTAAQAAAAGLASPAPLILHRTTSAANTPRSPAAAAAAAAAADAAMAAAMGEGGGSAVAGLVPQHLLMSHNSHISHQGSGIPQTPHTPHTPAAADAAALNASLVLGAAGGKGMMMGGMGGDANTLGSHIPSVAAAALVDLAGAGGQGYGGLESQWTWGMEGGMGGAPSQVGPSCITTGME